MEYLSGQALHSCRLTFTHPVTEQEMDFSASLPEDMERIIILKNQM
jgi:Pseudouridylate synthases, 23S RNA-specific